MNETDEKRMISQSSAARLLGVTYDRVNQLRKAGILRGERSDLGWLIRVADVLSERERRLAARHQPRGGRALQTPPPLPTTINSQG